MAAARLRGLLCILEKAEASLQSTSCKPDTCTACRFQYIDFLHYSWTAQMINQFEHTTIYVFLGIEVGCLLHPLSIQPGVSCGLGGTLLLPKAQMLSCVILQAHTETTGICCNSSDLVSKSSKTAVLLGTTSEPCMGMSSV